MDKCTTAVGRAGVRLSVLCVQVFPSSSTRIAWKCFVFHRDRIEPKQVIFQRCFVSAATMQTATSLLDRLNKLIFNRISQKLKINLSQYFSALA